MTYFTIGKIISSVFMLYTTLNIVLFFWKKKIIFLNAFTEEIKELRIDIIDDLYEEFGENSIISLTAKVFLAVILYIIISFIIYGILILVWPLLIIFILLLIIIIKIRINKNQVT